MDMDESDMVKMWLSKLKEILKEEGNSLSPVEMLKFYTDIYNFCFQTMNFDMQHIRGLYDGYSRILEQHMNDTVLPSILAEKEHGGDNSMLAELVNRWSTHKQKVRVLCSILCYLDRHFVPRMKLPSLHEVGIACFRNHVYEKVKGETIHDMISAADQEQLTDGSLLKSVKDLFTDMGDSV